MIIKVCGLKNHQNILAISELNIDMIGYNFYPLSQRYVDDTLHILPKKIKKVGVFVNADFETISQKVAQYGLNFVQLHGDESCSFVQKIQRIVPVIKVFRIDENFEANNLNEYQFCDYILFDTATKNYGGSGQKFNWEKLHEMPIKTPFLLSGGIGPEDASAIKNFTHPYFAGIDINSKFESSPGVKNVETIRSFIGTLDKI